MSMGFSPWQQRAFERALASLDSGRLGHGLLVCGPAKLGKRALVDAIVARLLCQDASGAQPACGHCRACKLQQAGTHADAYRISFALNDKGEPRNVIVVEQIRDLGQKISLTAQLGGAIVSVIDPAEALNANAANALLKTLEEPQDGRYLILVSDTPYRLPATIRSRCQRIELRPPPLEEARAWLAGQGIDGSRIDEALALADGHPGAALALIEAQGLQLRRAVEKDLDALAQNRIALSETVKAWLDDRPAERLAHAAACVRDRGRLALLALLAQGSGEAFAELADWYDQANRVRAQLDTPLRSDLLLGELLLRWREVAAA
ncbi:DNA polymerase III subunit delta' [Aquimonas sp.]|jgi:DNA polymerase-3 subunit delta'|uniref:DNA polymerase III subunit delta' n=1 Tax=Aquimonas sp. TaxID=1872588 RepID=UPI0037C0F2CD